MTREVSAGDILGRYELLAPVAKGGTALIWAARAVGGGSELVAVKTLLEADEQTRVMLRDEAALTTAIRHENVARLLDTGEDQGLPYLVMEWIDGEPLDMILHHVGRGGLPVAIAVELVQKACEGLHAAHELRDADGKLRGLVHRDISPQNLMVTYQGTVKLVDFGIAKATNRSTHTQLGQIKGKLAYMAPEQVRGTQVDRRTDVFAMGIVLYLLTTGSHPFKAKTPAETVRRILFAGPPPNPSRLVPDYPAALEPIVMKALASDPDQRHATALELSNELAEVAGSLGARPDVGAFLRGVLAERIHERREFLDEALACADLRQAAREVSTVPPPRSKAPSRNPPTLNPPPTDETLGAFSSLQALVVSGRAPAMTTETTGIRPVLLSPARNRKLPLIALASALAAACVFSLSVTHEPARAPVAYTTLGAPVRLVARTLAAFQR